MFEAHHLRQQEEACNPATNAERLEALSKDPALRGIVAGNPAAPAHLSERLPSWQPLRMGHGASQSGDDARTDTVNDDIPPVPHLIVRRWATSNAQLLGMH